MVNEVNINNFKSIQELNLELGRVNVFIGANGCGKSNILEAIAIGSAATENKLSNDFLSARGIRITEPTLMRAGFHKKNTISNISVVFKLPADVTVPIIISNDNTPFSEWYIDKDKEISNALRYNEAFNDYLDEIIDNHLEQEEVYSNAETPNSVGIHERRKAIRIDLINKYLDEFSNRIRISNDSVNQISNFIIYTPENSFLRKFEDETQIEPLGIRGEGLFKLISVMSSETPDEFKEIINNLEIIDWFEKFEIPKELNFNERKIRIKDRYIDKGLKYFDQRSSNEGFLFLLFYFTLFISKYTPKFFAIDNIDTSLNPKLCSELVKILVKLAKKYDKQVIFTTHNPAILDGLNLNDDEQRLFVTYRNIDGHTKVSRTKKKVVADGVEPVKLSEQFLRGYIGGLPKNF